MRIAFSNRRPENILPPDLGAEILKILNGKRSNLLEEALDFSELTKFQVEVLKAVATIPLGKTMTYGEVAQMLGRPGASRAVGRALAANPFPLIIPCHRVVAKDGLGGYSWGKDLKKKLLDLENQILVTE